LRAELVQREVDRIDSSFARKAEVDGLAHGLHREQQGELGIVVERLLGRGDQIVDRQQRLDIRLRVDRGTPLDGAEHGERGHEDSHEADDQELATALSLATLRHHSALLALEHLLRFPIAFADACAEEGPLRTGQLE
jgi:hypothetical protein